MSVCIILYLYVHCSLVAKCTRLVFKWLLATEKYVGAKVDLFLYQEIMKNFCLQ